MLPQPALTGDRHQLIFVERSLAAIHHLLDLRTQDAPDFVPAIPAALAQRRGMEVRSRGLAIGVVIELNELRSPPQQHRLMGIQQQAHSRPQALRPGFRRPQRATVPAMSARQSAHFPAAGEKIRGNRTSDIQHSGTTGGKFSPN
jgi:hypothetical protein